MATLTATRLMARVNRTDLLKVMKKLLPLTKSKVVPPLQGVLFQAGADGILWAMATNMEVVLRVGLAADVDSEGAIIIPARELATAIEFSRGELVEIQSDNVNARVLTGNDEFVIGGFGAENFPTMPEEWSPFFAIGRADLLELANATAVTAGNDESKPWLTGVFISTAGGNLTALSTDGARIGEWKKALPADGIWSCITVKQTLKLAASMAAPGEEVVVVRSANQVRLSGHNWQVVGRLIEGQYPDIRRYIPTEHTSTATMNQSDIMGACAVAKRMAKAGELKAEFMPLGVKFSVLLPDVVNFTRRVPATVKGEGITFGVDAFLTTPMVKELAGDEVTFSLTTNRAPVLITSQASPNVRYVILPLVTY